MQVLRTYPAVRPRYPFAPDGERTVARGYMKAIRRARRLIYLEDQYLWSTEVAAAVRARPCETNPDLHLVAVVPRHPDIDGRLALPPNQVGRELALRLCQEAAPDRVHVFDVENHEGTPVYVHAKVCVIDDVWASVGSDNFNRRSWTHDSELSCAVLDETHDPRAPHDPGGLGDGARVYARDLRLRLMARAPRPHRHRGPGRPGRGGGRHDRVGRERWTSGTATAARARARPAGCARTTRNGCRDSPGSGRSRSTAWSTTPTAAPSNSASAARSNPIYSKGGRWSLSVGVWWGGFAMSFVESVAVVRCLIAVGMDCLVSRGEGRGCSWRSTCFRMYVHVKACTCGKAPPYGGLRGVSPGGAGAT